MGDTLSCRNACIEVSSNSCCYSILVGDSLAASVIVARKWRVFRDSKFEGGILRCTIFPKLDTSLAEAIRTVKRKSQVMSTIYVQLAESKFHLLG